MRRFLHLMIFALVLTASSRYALAEHNDDTGERRGLSSASRFETRLITECREPWAAAGDEVIKAFEKAWSYTANGTKDSEAVVLVFRLDDGTYRGEWQGYTNEKYRFTFKWNPSAIAIVHTHPNSRSPEPESDDREVAKKFGVPIFTITNRGLYVYDPGTGRTNKVRKSLDWLKPCREESGGIFTLAR
jgi:hypothetical protein